MFTRWSQENFFKYMIANFDFDKMIEYGTRELNSKTIRIPNPSCVQLSYKIKKLREKKDEWKLNYIKRLTRKTPNL